MKADEAPEKLYLLQGNDLICYCRNNDEDVEYTRTDAFIEKACAWLEDNYPYYFETSIKEDFKNYMKENNL